MIECLPVATWSLPVRPIFIKRTSSRSRSSSQFSSIGWRTLIKIVDHAIARSWPSVHLKRYRTAMKTRGRTPRSRSDRTAIAARSSRDRGAYAMESPQLIKTTTDGDLGSWLTHDRGPIVAKNVVFFRLLWSQIHAYFKPIGKPRCRPKESLPWLRQTASTIASIGHDLRANFLFKTNVFLPLKLNFWSTRKEIKRFSRKVLSSRDPLLPSV